MENVVVAEQLKRGISRQSSTGSVRRGTLSRQFTRQSSLDPRRNNMRFSFGRQSSLDPIRRSPESLSCQPQMMSVPENLDSTMQLLFMASKGDVEGVEELLDEGIDVNSIDLDGRTALHIASCEGHYDVVRVLLSRRANIDARDRWGSTAAVDAKYYGNVEVFNLLKTRGAKPPKTRKTPMTVGNPKEVPEYELNPLELQVRKSDGITKGTYQVAKWNGTRVSVKISDKDSYTDPERVNAFNHELTVLAKARHPNIVQFVGAVTQNLPMMIVVEHNPKGDLSEYLQKKGRLSPSKALRFALDIARGMNYLHECRPDPVIHCDLRPKNILLDRGGQLKISGFGLIKLAKVSEDSVKVVNHEAHIDKSNTYIAPELYKNIIFDKSVDVHSFGVILYEITEGVSIFHPKPPEEVAETICMEGRRPTIKTKSKDINNSRILLIISRLIEECWHPDTSVRPIFSDIIIRLDNIVANCSKQGWWKDTFKFPWK
ncbi:unnamed protein product [Eruca vesicaria subsp. sativa]|uniref:non-specific serine/threonine protein kinase n=1 Tax=Eruca vesicaria subsp. sativa TaxID=29727 RepID=A0ABC8M1Y1_ERUVS|nr:unnamed protein product [Eruca vesicaria subsp. sativa]